MGWKGVWDPRSRSWPCAHQLSKELNAIVDVQVKFKPASSGELMEDIAAWMREHKLSKASGIVYCLTRKDTEAVAEQLHSAGLSTAHYHADMDPMTRQAVHLQWCKGDIQNTISALHLCSSFVLFKTLKNKLLVLCIMLEHCCLSRLRASC